MKFKVSLQKILRQICMFILSEVDKTVMTLCRTVLFKVIKEPPKNAVKIDFVKMQNQHYTQSPNKAKLNVLLFTPST